MKRRRDVATPSFEVTYFHSRANTSHEIPRHIFDSKINYKWGFSLRYAVTENSLCDKVAFVWQEELRWLYAGDLFRHVYRYTSRLVPFQRIKRYSPRLQTVDLSGVICDVKKNTSMHGWKLREMEIFWTRWSDRIIRSWTARFCNAIDSKATRYHSPVSLTRRGSDVHGTDLNQTCGTWRSRLEV